MLDAFQLFEKWSTPNPINSLLIFAENQLCMNESAFAPTVDDAKNRPQKKTQKCKIGHHGNPVLNKSYAF